MTGERVGAIPSDIVLIASQAVRRNATDTAFEAFIPAAGSAETDPVFTASEAANFVTGDKTKLDGIATGAEVNVNADWSASSGDEQILNKPTVLVLDGVAKLTVGTSVSGTPATGDLWIDTN